MPSRDLVEKFWDQCQHGSWYFLPWHRGYLLAFEANVRAAVIELGGPTDWALPYWNYFKRDESALPPAFASPDWPDGGENPLFVQPRYGPDGDGNVHIPLSQVNVRAMRDPDFTGVSGGSPGFGGLDTGFSHNGRHHGGIESQPHDMVHVLVGGFNHNDQQQPGAMTVPDSAGLDPIFWLHHANIDRLWESWIHELPPHLDPTDPNWVKGPPNVGERPFRMPMPGGATKTYTPGEMIKIRRLGYRYDHLSPLPAPPAPHERLERLGIAAPAEGAQPMPGDANVELVGATSQSVPIRGSEARSGIRLDPGMRRKVAASLAPAIAAAGPQAAPDRLFLNLENVRGAADAPAFDVFVGVPDGEDPAAHADRLAGSIAPFGLAKASRTDGEHAGQGLTFVLEITDIVDRLHLENSLDVDSLPVRIVPMHPIAEDAGITIGRISIFRQGG
jgi:tyrosinase